MGGNGSINRINSMNCLRRPVLVPPPIQTSLFVLGLRWIASLRTLVSRRLARLHICSHALPWVAALILLRCPAVGGHAKTTSAREAAYVGFALGFLTGSRLST